MKAVELLTKARAGLILDQPFFGSLAIRHRLVEDATIETCCINGKVIKYNPDFIQGLTLDQCKGLLAHEVMHVALLHHTRRGNRNHKLWNEAGDYAINLILREAGFYIPNNGLIDHSFNGWSADQIYAELQARQQQDQPKPDDKNDNGDGDGEGEQDQDEQQGDDSNDDGNGGTGWGDVEDAQGDDGTPITSQAELSQVEQEAKIMVNQATLEARMQGKLSGGIDRAVNETMTTEVNWREVLQEFIKAHAKNDYTWSRPNRRFISQGLYLPSLHSDELGNIVVAVDTSGSIDHKALNQMVSELNAIMNEVEATCTVIYCDSSVKVVEEFTKSDLPIVSNPVGGGGTDFRPVFDYVNENAIDPVCMIYLTDMAGEFPDEAPQYPVLWGVTDARYYRDTPPFGKCVIVSD